MNCIIWGNTSNTLYETGSISFSCIQNWTRTDNGNISADPIFVNSASGDFHLSPGSPCIDSGKAILNVTQDFEGNPRPFGAGFDMGAYEYVPKMEVSISVSPVEGIVPLTVDLVGTATAGSGWIQDYHWLFDVGVSSDVYYVSDVSNHF